MKWLVTIVCMALVVCAFAQDEFLSGKSWSFRAQPASGGYFGGLVSTNNLVAYWRMDEVSDGSAAVTRNDSFGANNLTDNSTFAASATGLITNAVDIESSVTEYLSISSNAAVNMPSGTSFTITGWMKPESTPTTAPLLCKATATGTGTEYMIWINGSTDFRARVADGTNQGTVTNTVTPSTGNWFFIAFRCDLAADQLKLRVNSTDSTVTTYTGDTKNTSSNLEIGRLPYSTSNRSDGLTDEVGIWKRVLSDAELDALYNSGSGRTL